MEIARKIVSAFAVLFMLDVALASEWYIDANNGSDETGDGSAESPFATINRASTNSTKLASGDTIWVRPGTYSTGVYVDADGVSNRVYISKANVNLKATDPDSLTEIVGAKDETSGNSHGLGTAAIRCVRSVGSCTMQGFTLRDGATDVGDANKGYGGGYFGSGYLVDCVVRNCSATKGGGMRNGYAVRTLFTGCTSSSNGGASNGGSLSFCVIVNCGGQGSVSNSKTVNCTFLDNETNPIVGSMPSYNCLFLGNSRAPVQGVPQNNCVSDSNGGVAQLMNPALGDYRPIMGSVASGAGNREYLAEAPSGYSDKDFNGDDIAETGDIPVGAVFSVSPAPVAGCIYFKGGSATVDGVAVANGLWMYPTNYPVRWTVSPVVPDGQYFCCYIHDERTGWRTYPHPDGMCRMSPPSDPSLVITCTVAIASLYVDREHGSDTKNSGTSKNDAFQTLARALTNSTLSAGQFVHVAAGTYDTCQMKNASSAKTYSRAVVPSGVELVAGDGPENTFIVGAAASVDADESGLGEGAVRCVYLNENATVRGFTLSGGRTMKPSATETNEEKTGADWTGGGVRGSGLSSLIADCIVSNNWANRGGGAFNAMFKRCRVICNNAVNAGAAGASSGAVGTLFAANTNSSSYAVMLYPIEMTGCTMAGDNSGLYLAMLDDNRRLVNNVFDGKVHFNFAQQNNPAFMTNCIFASTPTKPGGTFEFGTGSYQTNSAAIGLDETYRPIVGGSVCIDAAYVDATLRRAMEDLDASCGQRIYNNALDIGALEGDYRPVFAEAMDAGRHIVVTSADPSVRLSERGVAMSSGGLELAWAQPQGEKSDFFFDVAVTGGGSLYAHFNGATACVDAASGARTISFVSSMPDNAVSFAFSPVTDAGECLAVLSRFTRSRRSGFVLVVR